MQGKASARADGRHQTDNSLEVCLAQHCDTNHRDPVVPLVGGHAGLVLAAALRVDALQELFSDTQGRCQTNELFATTNELLMVHWQPSIALALQ